MRNADREWMGRALCADMDTSTFFPIAKVATRKAYLAEVNAAQKVCRMCPVVADCAGYALRNGIRWGIWGGIDMEHLPRRDRVRLGVGFAAGLDAAREAVQEWISYTFPGHCPSWTAQIPAAIDALKEQS